MLPAGSNPLSAVEASITIPLLPVQALFTLPQGLDDECKDDESEEHHIEFLEKRKDSPESLQSTKYPLDFVVPLVHLAVL